ncbi:MAG TPA: beta-ketoacyl-[acyl-carrier-protein] synthase family protein [Fibrobacteria bacterium]|nr:beta-ketoacyl-[acyl-carrier-protein] synthase family protein [Fibrobacteria bacterium]
MKPRVVVTGMGIVSSAGSGLESFWETCLQGRLTLEAIPRFWTLFHRFDCKAWAKLADLPRDQAFLTEIEEKQLDPASILGAYAAKQALEDASLATLPGQGNSNSFLIQGYLPERMAVFTGTGVAGIQSILSAYSYHVLHALKTKLQDLREEAGSGSKSDLLAMMRTPRRYHPFIVSMSMANAVSGTVSIKHGITGPSSTFCSSCASGTISIGKAAQAITEGRADMVLAGGAEYLFDEFGCTFRGFDNVGALAKGCTETHSTYRPFDRNRTGFLMAEGGAAYLVLETEENARRRGARIYAEIAAFSETCDAYNKMAMEPTGKQIRIMLESLLGEGGVAPGDIDYINAHGTGTEINDEVETRAISALFGKGPAVNSTKSVTGHSLGASGAIEAAATCLSVFHQKTHGCVGLEEPIADLDFVRKARELRIRHAVSQSFGFGGHNAALLFNQVT